MILKLSLVREISGDEGTLGRLIVGGFRFETLELPDRNNAPSLSRCNNDVYRMQFTKSTLFPNGTFQEVDKNDRTGIRIHTGNWGGDVTKGYASDILGCILIGLKRDRRSNQDWMDHHKQGSKGFIQTGIFESKDAFTKFMAYVGLDPFDLEVMVENQ